MYRIRTGSKFDFERGKQTSHQIQIEDPFATYLFMFGESKLAVWLWLSLHMEKGGAVTLDLDQAIADCGIAGTTILAAVQGLLRTCVDGHRLMVKTGYDEETNLTFILYPTAEQVAEWEGDHVAAL
jgi:hypothetical protein